MRRPGFLADVDQPITAPTTEPLPAPPTPPASDLISKLKGDGYVKGTESDAARTRRMAVLQAREAELRQGRLDLIARIGRLPIRMPPRRTGGSHHRPIQCEPVICPEGQKLSRRSHRSCGQCIPKTIEDVIREEKNRMRSLAEGWIQECSESVRRKFPLDITEISKLDRHESERLRKLATGQMKKCIESKRAALLKCIEPSTPVLAGIPTEYLIGGAILAILLLRKRSI